MIDITHTEPLIEVREDNGVLYTVACIPPHPLDWQFLLHDPFFRKQLGDRVMQLDEQVKSGIMRLYATQTEAMSAHIAANGHDFKKVLILGSGLPLLCMPNTPADGLMMPPACGYVMPAAGCALGVAIANNVCVAFHAGFASLVDFDRVKGLSPRRHESVIDAVVDLFARYEIEPQSIFIGLFFGYAPADYRFDRSEFAAFNEALRSDLANRLGFGCMDRCTGSVDIAWIARRLAQKRGVESIITRHPLRSGSGFALSREAGRLGTARNLTIMLRHV